MLKLENVCFFKDNKDILKNINLEIDEGKFIAITGPNGSGKSTLAKIIMGIERPTSGKIIFNDEDITNLSVTDRAQKGISFAFQQPVKFKGITVYDLLKLASKKEVSRKDACEYLSKVGLCAKEYIDREINSSLSGGELKRIEIATVALRQAKLTIFDEPEAGIDLWSFNNLIEVFENMRETIKGSIIIISHQEKILNIADQIVLLNEGQVEQIGENGLSLGGILERSDCCRLNSKGGSHGQ